MRKSLTLLTATLLTACSSGGPNPEWVSELEASGYAKDAVWLAGDGTKDQHYGFPNFDIANAVVKNNKGQTGSLVGYIWDAQVNGNKLAIEVIPTFSGENAKRCTGNIKQHRLDCLEQRGGFFLSNVTCHVNNLKQFYAAGGKRIGADIPKKWQSSTHWNHVLVQGKIRNIEVKGVEFKRYVGGKSSLDFGDLGGTVTDGFRYNSVHLDDCRIYTFRGKAILPNS